MKLYKFSSFNIIKSILLQKNKTAKTKSLLFCIYFFQVLIGY